MLCWYNCTWNQIAYLRLASYCMFASAAKSNHCMLVRWQHYNGGTESSQLRHFSGTFAYICNCRHFPSFASHCLFEAHLSGSDWQLYHRVKNSIYIPQNSNTASKIPNTASQSPNTASQIPNTASQMHWVRLAAVLLCHQLGTTWE